MTLPVVFTANGPSGYNLTKSLRFRESASAYLSRTPASAGNRQIWTYSTWIKRGSLGQTFLLSGESGTNNDEYQYIYITSGGVMQFVIGQIGSNPHLTNSTAVFRDPSAWYHIVSVFDSTQATAANRWRLYVNNVEQTMTGTVMSQNYNSGWINNNTRQGIMGRLNYSTSTGDGYLAETNFINGQALTPSSFGSYNSLTGVWQPAKYTGTYGTTGYYLPYTNTTSTTTLGYDFSGNSNNWTTNNISLTAGTTYDSMTDVPTLTSATTANYCVLNPLNNGGIGTASITDGNLKITYSSADSLALGTIGLVSGKWYWEITGISVTSGTNFTVGVSPSPYTSANSRLYASNGQYYNGSAWASYGATYTNNDVIGIALDLNSQTIEFFKNGTSQGQKTSIGLSGITEFPQIYINNSGNSAVANFGQQGFAYTPPTGYVALNTYNLPTSTIVKGNTVMDATLYTGTGSALSVTNTAGFKPDLVWLKGRSFTSFNGLIDSVRGRAYDLYSNSTSAEETSGSTEDLTSFNTNGFSLGTSARFASNNSGQTYVGWQWQAGQGTTSSNTSGSITSTVSVNASAGFSVVTYTGNGSSGATVGHGLGVAPSMIIVKERSVSSRWDVYHASIGATGRLILNETTGTETSSGAWNNTAPTSSVFSVGTATETNESGQPLVAYCWSEIAGFSKFGSYTGNASTDGPFIYTGFRPKYIMFKRSDSTGDWYVWDTVRNTYNAAGNALYPNYNIAEVDYGTGSGGIVDILSNGFKLRTNGVVGNSSGATYIYMAFAENPFKNALAR